ncbi:hypothetical protein [Rhodococcus sp. HNM0569]|uniref:hypothetical protein n=1 Tax=Rhodococcus sp. HNM0569 TaxID=2716340 RepID=UPI00146E801A|nr:hypothetical protein [Rhodococcus sp. HNM0569]
MSEQHGGTSGGDFAHSDAATRRRQEKARALARFAWDRGISSTELLALPDATLRALARAADANPPSTRETWQQVAALLDVKDDWAARNPEHAAAARPHRDEKIMWVKPPVQPW